MYSSDTVKPVYNLDHPKDLKIVVIIERWLLFKNHLWYENLKIELKKCDSRSRKEITPQMLFLNSSLSVYKIAVKRSSFFELLLIELVNTTSPISF